MAASLYSPAFRCPECSVRISPSSLRHRTRPAVSEDGCYVSVRSSCPICGATFTETFALLAVLSTDGLAVCRTSLYGRS